MNEADPPSATTRRRALIFAFIALAALLLAIRLSTGTASRSPESTVDPAAGASSSAPPPGSLDIRAVSARPTSLNPQAPELLGLILLSREETLALGWDESPLEEAPPEMAQAAREKWAESIVAVNYADTPIADVLTDLRVRYGLDARLDPELQVGDYKATFRVWDLPARETFDLILKMLDLKSGMDPMGVLWVATAERIEAVCGKLPDEVLPEVRSTMNAVRELSSPTQDPPRDRRPSAWIQHRLVTVSIVNKPVDEAIALLAEAGGVKIRRWSVDGKDSAAKRPIVSLVGEHLEFPEVLEKMLADAGLALEMHHGAEASVESVKEHEDFLQQVREYAAAERAYLKLKTGIRERRVRIDGPRLTLSDVAAQISTQLGVPVVLAPGTERCRYLWKSDGMEQSVGEVLSLLTSPAGLYWEFVELTDADGHVMGPRSIWLVPRW